MKNIFLAVFFALILSSCTGNKSESPAPAPNEIGQYTPSKTEWLAMEGRYLCRKFETEALVFFIYPGDPETQRDTIAVSVHTRYDSDNHKMKETAVVKKMRAECKKWIDRYATEFKRWGGITVVEVPAE